MLPDSQAPLPGQRWFSEAEPELGLGIIRAASAGRLTVGFPAAGIERTYAWPGAPLRRFRAAAGECLRHRDGRNGVVASVLARGARLFYQIQDGETWDEEALADHLAAALPLDRLRRGDADAPDVFDLRIEGLLRRARLRKSPARGFIGARISLIPHQLAVAATVAARPHPRVLLADEVGLGKTIEAGLVMHRLHLTGRADRILVLVPEPLLHQWFVEMLRRFHLHFTIFDTDRGAALAEHDADANPFLDSQLALAPLDWLAGDSRAADACLAAGWDMVVIDEAHRLVPPPHPRAAEWSFVRQLASAVPSVLLLTATPDQSGLESHFARLQLLDPARFSDIEAFRRELETHALTAAAAIPLAAGKPPPREVIGTLADRSPRLRQLVAAMEAGGSETHDAILDALLDSFGPGRIVFRNQRTALTGFPVRHCHLVPLESSAPECRLDWLAGLVRRVHPDKLLVVTASPEAAEAIADGLRQRVAVDTAVFHEGHSLVQRDRFAAWFTDPDGARVLVSSEIGSEGRNFQCARHLVLFDLPDDPALLEQRIGRLDRIGQAGAFHLHVPFAPGSRDAVLAAWYDRALDAFTAHSPGAIATVAAFGDRLAHCLQFPHDADALESLIDDAREHCASVARRFAEGTSRLLALHSARPGLADQLAGLIADADADASVESFFIRLMEHFGIRCDPTEHRGWVLRPDYVAAAALPELPPDGITVTTDRTHALRREDLDFLTTDHPLWRGALDALLGNSQGNACFALAQGRSPACWCEAWFVIECPAPARLHLDRFLPPLPVRIVIDHALEDRSADRSLLSLPLRPMPDPGKFVSELLQSGGFEALIDTANRVAATRLDTAIRKARESTRRHFASEISRLEDLATHDGHPAAVEAACLTALSEEIDRACDHARLRLDACRIVRQMESDL